MPATVARSGGRRTLPMRQRRRAGPSGAPGSVAQGPSLPQVEQVLLPPAEADAAGAVAAAAFPRPGALRREVMRQGVGLAGASGAVLTAATAAAGLSVPLTAPAAAGALVGALAARCAHALAPEGGEKSLGVVITGSTRGVGRALAREHLWAGDSVVVSGRSTRATREAVEDLRRETGVPPERVVGIPCDVTEAADVARLARLAERALSPVGGVRVWVNNAAASGSFQPFLDAAPSTLGAVVGTNLLGTLLGTQEAVKLFKAKGCGGHVFNVDGAGADFGATPFYAAYGATKAATRQLLRSLRAELAADGAEVGLHALSPGMVLTELLLENASSANKQIFNVLCEQPETVAAFLVPRVRATATDTAAGGAGKYFRFLTVASALCNFAAYPSRKGRFFDASGEPVFPPESERVEALIREREVAAARGAPTSDFWALWNIADVAGLPLRYAYSASLSLAFVALALPAYIHTGPALAAMLHLPP